jgi:TPR repeat protein
MSIIDKLLEGKNQIVEKILDEPDSEFYAQAEQEINDGTIDQGLWAKALVKAKGSERLRKPEYIKLRAKQLQAQQRQIAQLLPRIAQNIQKIGADAQSPKKAEVLIDSGWILQNLIAVGEAEAEDADAYNQLAERAKVGDKDARDELAKIAEAGNSNAQYELALMCENGQGLPQNLKKAYYWFKKAAKQGHEEASKRINMPMPF